MENLRETLEKEFAEQNRIVIRNFFMNRALNTTDAAATLERGLLLNRKIKAEATAIIDKVNHNTSA